MPNWKKVAVSGSAASFSSLSVDTSITASIVSSSQFTGSLFGTASYALTASSATQFNVTQALTASGLIYPTADGITGQFVITDGVGTLSFDDVHTILEEVRYGENISIGDPLYVSGSNGTRPVVYKADAAIASKMPVIYIAKTTATANTNTTAIILGLITGVTTTGYPNGTIVYVAEGGGWSANRPTGSNSIVQPLGIVTKEGSGGSGRGIVLNPGPAFLPNLQTGYTWVGNGNNQPTVVATSSIQNVVSSSYALTATSASYALTSSYLNPVTSGYVVLTQVSQSLNFADDAAAAANGVPLGGLYRNGNFILIRIS